VSINLSIKNSLFCTKRILPVILIAFLFAVSILFVYYLEKTSDWHDFDVFYDAATAAITGKSIYIIVGKYDLPFWYFPWSAWFYIPYAIWPKEIGLLLYKITSAICAFLIVSGLTKYYQPHVKFHYQLLIIAFLAPMSSQLIMVGQMDYLLLALLVGAIWAAENNKDILVGMIFPFLLVKPHLIIPFSIFLFLRLPKRAILVSLLFCLVMILIETILDRNWINNLIALFLSSGQRTDGLKFMTFSAFLGFHENWSGTANIPLSLLLLIITTVILWKFRNLPTIPFLSFALVASLVCAPRAYAYDLPLIIPAVIWLTAGNLNRYWWLWAIVGLFPYFVSFSSYTYLIIFIVFVLCIYKASRTRLSFETIDPKIYL
jgi:hypothetical protein